MSVPLTSEQCSLVERNLRLAYRFANDYTRSHRVRYRDDIVSAALEGLTLAAKKYDPARAKFSTYAKWWMRARVHHAVVKSFVVHIPAPAFAAGSKFADFRDRAASCGEVTDQIPARADRLEDLGEVLDALERSGAIPVRPRAGLRRGQDVRRGGGGIEDLPDEGRADRPRGDRATQGDLRSRIMIGPVGLRSHCRAINKWQHD